MRHPGFTLVELLVVIAIVAILAAILFPVFARAKTAAKKTDDLARVKQLSTSSVLYSADFDDNLLVFPYADVWSSPSYGSGQKGQFWTDRLMPYVKSGELFSSPTNSDPVWYPRGYWLPGALSAGQPAPGYRVTYSLNTMVVRGDAHPDRPGSTPESSIDVVSEIALLGPGQTPWNWHTCVQEPGGGGQTHYYWAFSESGMGWGYELFGGQNDRGGFDGGANFSYIDTHARFSRTVNTGTDPGDQISYQGRDLFRGYFGGVKTRNLVGSDGTCPAQRGSVSY